MKKKPAGPPSQRLVWAILAAMVFLFANLLPLAHLSGDEAWFLNVIDRARRGDTLYRDVFLGVTPLAVYLSLPFTWLLGAELLVIRALTALTFVASLWLGCRIVRRFRPGRFPWLLAGFLLTFCLPPWMLSWTSFYTPLGATLLLAAWEASLGAPAPRAALLAGLWAGLSFAAKQNYGALAAAAVGASLLLHAAPWKERVQLALRATGGFLGATIVLLLPVVISGGAPKLWEYGFQKGAYLQTASVSYFDAFRLLAQGLRAGFGDQPWEHYRLTAYFVAPVVFVAVALSLWRAPAEWRRLAAALVFTVAGFLGLFPRSGTHLTYALPFLATGMTVAWSVLRDAIPPWPRRGLLAALWLWVAIGFLLMLRSAFAWWDVPRTKLASLPHFRGLVMSEDRHQQLEAVARALAREKPLLLTEMAGFFYLISGYRNPTAYDYPVVPAFGRRGEAEIIEKITRGEITAVCMPPLAGRPAQTERLEQYVESSLRRGENLGLCTLYRR
jgi:hypothetical protein